MASKQTVFVDDESGIHLYEEIGPEQARLLAYIAALNPPMCSFTGDVEQRRIVLAIDPVILDQLAIAWCIHRKLHGALGGPVGRELGSPDCEYD